MKPSMSLELILIVLVAAALAILSAIALVVRRLRFVRTEIQAQFSLFQAQIDLARNDHNLWAARLHREMGEIREVHTKVEGFVNQLNEVAVSPWNAVAARVESISAIAEAAAPKLEKMLTLLEMLARQSGRPLFVDPLLTEARTPQELAALAESIAILRPLVPYPNWRFNADVENPDLSYRLRRWFWQYFHDRRSDATIVVPWHASTRLRLFLGNDVSSQIYIAGCFEPNEIAFLDRILKPGMTFVDAGANDGLYTVFAASRVGLAGTVWAFEPSSRELARLKHNLELNELNACIFGLGLGDANGQAELTLGGYGHEGHNTLGAFAYEGIESGGSERISLRRLDDLVAEHSLSRIDVMKLDVEGAELRLLHGATKVLQEHRPWLLFEVSEVSLGNQGCGPVDLLEFLVSQKYSIYAFDRTTGLVVRAPEGVHSDNMVGVPDDRPLPNSVHWPWPLDTMGA
jgi:FkbM family methyltransferase